VHGYIVRPGVFYGVQGNACAGIPNMGQVWVGDINAGAGAPLHLPAVPPPGAAAACAPLWFTASA
jgi:hypothetical protein